MNKKGRPQLPPQMHTTVVAFTLTPKIKERLEKYMVLHEIYNRSNLIEFVIKDFLDKEDKKDNQPAE